MVSRVDRSAMAEWWRTVDRPLLGSVMFLMLCGVLLSFAASPRSPSASALDSFHFVKRHAMFLIPALGADARRSRSCRHGRCGARASCSSASRILLMMATLFFGVEVKGSRRWITLAGISHPAVGIPEAGLRRHLRLAVCRTRAPAGNPGQSVRHHPVRHRRARCWSRSPISARPCWSPIVWGAHVLHGRHAVAVDRRARRHRRRRRFGAPIPSSRTSPAASTGSSPARATPSRSTRRARRSSMAAGWGRGRARARSSASSRTAIPTSSFAVAAEEFGIIVCMLLVALFAFIVLRGLNHALREKDAYVRACSRRPGHCCSAIQSMINMGVNLQLMPAKGMTLPFISYGGSSHDRDGHLAWASCWR